MYIQVGSTYFFSKFKDFKSKDRDFIELVDNPIGFNYVRQTSGSYCLFEWKRMNPEEFIHYALSKGPAMQLGKFLVPEFNYEIGFTIEHLKQLQPLVEKLDNKHKYEKVIYDAYIANNDFILTDDQLNEAYSMFKFYRKESREDLIESESKNKIKN